MEKINCWRSECYKANSYNVPRRIDIRPMRTSEVDHIWWDYQRILCNPLYMC